MQSSTEHPAKSNKERDTLTMNEINSKDDAEGKAKPIIVSDQVGSEVIEFLDTLNRQVDDSEKSADEKVINKILGASKTNIPKLDVESLHAPASPLPEPTSKPIDDEQKARVLKEARATFTNISRVEETEPATTTYEKASNLFIAKLPLIAAVYLAIIAAALAFDAIRVYAHERTVEARNLNEAGDYQAALKQAYLASRWNFLSAEAFRERGKALSHLLRLTEAETCFNTALLLAPNDLESLDGRAALSAKLNKADQTIADTSKLIGLTKDPSNLHAYHFGNRAIAYYRKGNYKAALADYDRALKMEPINYSLQLSRAFCLAADGQYKEALAMCDFLLKLYPENDQVLCQRGFCLQALGQPKQALNDFNLAISRDPLTARWHIYRGGLYRCLGNFKAATSDYTLAANLDPTEESVQYTAAALLKEQGQHEAALAIYNRLANSTCFKNFKKSFIGQKERAQLLAEQGNYREALKDCNGALKIKFDYSTQLLKALCLAHLGPASIRDAEICLDDAAKASHNKAEQKALLHSRAQVATIAGNSASAITIYTQILNENPGDKAALASRAALYKNRQQWASAAADYNKAMALGAQGLEDEYKQCQKVLHKSSQISPLLCEKTVNLSKLNNKSLAEQGYKLFTASDSLAAAYFAELTRREPTKIEWRRYLAYSLEAAGRHNEAAACFDQMAQAGALTRQDRLCLARALSADGQHQRALAEIERISNTADARIKLEYAKILSAGGQDEKAIGICRAALAQTGCEYSSQLNNLLQSLLRGKQRQIDKEEHNQAKPETEG